MAARHFLRVSTRHTADEPAEEANFRHLVWDIAWFGLGLAAISRFVSVFAIRVGANPTELSLIASLPALILLISSSFGAWWTRRYHNPVRALAMPSIGFRLVFLLPAFTPFFPPDWQPLWLIAALALPAIPQGLAAVSFVVMMRNAVSKERMPLLLSRRSLALNVGLAVAALGFGLWLEYAPFPLNYQIMFVLAFAFGMASWRHVQRIQVQETPRPREQDQPHSSPWRSPNFLRVAAVSAIIHIAFFSINPITPLHIVSNLGASEAFMAVFGLVELAAGAAVAMATDRIVKWIGYRHMIALSMIGTALSAVIIALAPNAYITLLAAALSGASWTAAAMVGLFGYFTQNAPADEMPGYSAAYHQAIGLATFVGPLIGSALANSGMTLVGVMLVGAALRFIAAPLVDFESIAKRVRHIDLHLPHPHSHKGDLAHKGVES